MPPQCRSSSATLPVFASSSMAAAVAAAVTAAAATPTEVALYMLPLGGGRESRSMASCSVRAEILACHSRILTRTTYARTEMRMTAMKRALQRACVRGVVCGEGGGGKGEREEGRESKGHNVRSA